MSRFGVIGGIIIGTVAASLMACTTQEVNQDPMIKSQALYQSAEIKIVDLNRALKLDPQNSGLYAKRARLYWQEKKLAAALADIDQAITLNTNQPDYYFWKAVILRDMGRLTQALETVAEAEKLGFKDQNGYLLEAELLIKKKKYQAGLEKVNQALNEEPDNEYGLFYKGIARAALGDTASALVLYRRAIRYAPEFVHPYLQISSIANAQKNFAEADQYLKSSGRLEPQNAFLWYQRGLRYRGLKKLDSARVSFEKSSRLDPDLYQANYYLALLAYKQGKYEEVVANLEKIKSGLRNLEQGQEMLAESYEKTKQFDKALAVYTQILRRKPNDVKTMWGLRRSGWGLRKMQRDSVALTLPDQDYTDIIQDTVF